MKKEKKPVMGKGQAWGKKTLLSEEEKKKRARERWQKKDFNWLF